MKSNNKYNVIDTFIVGKNQMKNCYGNNSKTPNERK